VISVEEIHHVLAQGMQAARQVLARAAGLIHAGSAPPETGES
jgi:hypothetical protein